MLRQIEVWTDGACRRTGQGGWAAIAIEDAKTIAEWSGKRPKTTSNKMEMMGVIKALRRAPLDCNLTIYSDSQYTVKGINEWVHGWERRAWKTATGEPVKNQAYWRMMIRALQRRKGPTTIMWVKGHAGLTYNEMADRLAVGASQSC